MDFEELSTQVNAQRYISQEEDELKDKEDARPVVNQTATSTSSLATPSSVPVLCSLCRQKEASFVCIHERKNGKATIHLACCSQCSVGVFVRRRCPVCSFQFSVMAKKSSN